MNETKNLKKGKAIEILLVEDNPGDIRLAQEAFKESNVCNNLHVVEDGREAIDFLRKKGKYADTPRPDIILLDLNLPVIDGRDVLAEIKEDKSLRSVPVLVLTTSRAEEDVIKSYNMHANCFITKPVDMERFIEVVKTIEEFWFNIVKLPMR